MVGAGGACVLDSTDAVVVVVVVMIAGMAIAVAVAAFAGVRVVVLVAVGSMGGADGLLASDWARALPAANVSTAARTNPPAMKAPGLRRRLRRRNANSAIELHAAIAPAGCPPPVLQPNRLFESLYWPSAAWHQPLSNVQPGE